MERNRWNHFGDCHRLPIEHCTGKRLLRTETKLSFRAFRVETVTVVNELIFLGKKLLVSPGLENTGLVMFLTILTSAAPRSICRLGKQSPVFSRPREMRCIYMVSRQWKGIDWEECVTWGLTYLLVCLLHEHWHVSKNNAAPFFKDVRLAADWRIAGRALKVSAPW